MGLILKIAAGIVLAVVVLAFGCTALVSTDTTDVAELTDDYSTDAAIEEELPSATWEWVDKPVCGLDARCWQIRVSSDDGCPNGLYAELNLLDEAGTVIDYTNDSLGVLPPATSAVLTFETYNAAAAKGDVAQVTCN